VCQVELGGSIDPYVFVDDSGQRFLLWKSDAPCCDLEPSIWIQPLSDDGQALLETPTELLHPDCPWEGGVVEAPTLIQRHGTYYLFYSGNDYASAQYAIGYAHAPAVLGPYRKPPGPLLATSQRGTPVIGPGGQDILERGEATWMVYHTWDPTLTYRFLRMARLAWKGTTPILNSGASQ
jgi:beta-xylosidase